MVGAAETGASALIRKVAPNMPTITFFKTFEHLLLQFN
ncbi:Uncharacterised protein [Brucella neotomae]|nr:Uncharacterised protein [Brucella neotomae]